MRLAFLGTPEFAVVSLAAIVAAGFEIADVHYERRLYGAYTCVKSG